MVCYGVDFGGTTTKIGLFSQEGTLLEKWEIPTRVDTDLATMLQDIATALLQKLAERNLPMQELLGVGIGVAGPVEKNGYTEACVNLNIFDFNPNELLSPLLGGAPVFTANDANLAALGEMWHGSGSGFDSAVFVTLGTGIGSGVILDGNIVYGTKGLAGEIGHISVNPNETLRCNCGGKGCLDQTASATGIVRHAKRFLSNSDAPSTLRGKADFSAADVFDAAKAGDPIAFETVDFCLHFLGKCLSDVGYVVDPQIFILGGGVSKAGQFLIDITQRHYKKYPLLKKETALFSLAALGNDAGIHGGARLVLQSLHLI